MNFSLTYIDLYAKARCGKKEGLTELIRLDEEEGDNLAKGYQAMVLERSSILSIPRNRDKAVQLLNTIRPWLLEKAEEKDAYDVANVWYLLGYCYSDGVAVDRKDYPTAVYYYKLSADVGHALGQCALGNCYDVGDGVNQNVPKALRLYHLSADQNFAVAQSNVGMCYEHGEGADMDQAKAIEYAELAAAQGYVDAIYNLSMYYFYGKGMEVSTTEGFRYCSMGAEQGDVECLFVLGDCYFRGIGTDVDEVKGFDCTLKAAEAGHDLSMLAIAKCFTNGIVVSADIIEAVRYLRRAEKLGVEQATTMLATAESKYKAQVWRNRKNFLMFLATYEFLYSTTTVSANPESDNYTHTSFYTRDICWYISQYL